MKCSDIQFELSLYSDPTGEPSAPEIGEHLDQCPVCREQLDQLRSLRTGLSRLRRVSLSRSAARRIHDTVVAESLERHRLLTPSVRRWLEFRVMPYGLGAAASIVIGFGFLTMMFSGMLGPRISPAPGRAANSTIMLANTFDPYRVANPDEISPNEFVRSRMAFSGESPSVNPQGALIALTKSVVRGEMRDEEVVIVADVFGSGLARISEVIEPSGNDKIIQELRKALDTDLASAPFVPASVENRPESMRVVFMMQSVNVSTRDRRGRTRL